MSKISVAMTTYNGEKFILQQLQSLLNQKRRPDEVIIRDDCSKDSTVNIIENFIKNNNLTSWKLIINNKNCGYIENFRKAICDTQGDIIFLCDQDDIWHKDKIERMSSLMEQNEDIKALACSYNFIDAENREITGEEKFYTPKNNKEALSKIDYGKILYYNIAQGCAAAYRRNICEKYINSASSSLPHDWALNIISYETSGLYYLNEELFSYRLHTNNTTGIMNKDSSVKNRIPNLENYALFMQEVSTLNIKEECKKIYSEVSIFTRNRIKFLKNKKISTWLKGFKNKNALKILFLPYLKDLALVITRKIA